MFNLLQGLFGNKAGQDSEDDSMSLEEARETKDEEAEIFKTLRTDEEVLGMGTDRKTVKRDLSDRRRDLTKLRGQIRTHWSKYKEALERVREESGIDELESKTKAAEAKKAAKDKQQLFKLLYKEYSALKKAMRKDETIKLVSGDKYRVSLGEVDNASIEQQVDQYRSELMQAENNVKDFNRELGRADHEIELDFTDLEKDVSELEMDTSDMDEDLQIVVAGPEEEFASQEWETS